jgi:hypothetical protein
MREAGTRIIADEIRIFFRVHPRSIVVYFLGVGEAFGALAFAAWTFNWFLTPVTPSTPFATVSARAF